MLPQKEEKGISVRISDTVRVSDSEVCLVNAQTQPLEAAKPPELDENRLAWLALTLAPNLGPKRILDAVEQHDGEKARSAMRAHLLQVREDSKASEAQPLLRSTS